jgi:hypothetical protein
MKRTSLALLTLVLTLLMIAAAVPSAQTRYTPVLSYIRAIVDVFDPTTPLPPARRGVESDVPTFKEPESGYIPAECQDEYAALSPYVVDCWLNAHPTIAANILWEMQKVPAGDSNYVKPWAQWEEWRRAGLRLTVIELQKWRSTGMKAPFNGLKSFEDVPPNEDAPFWAAGEGGSTVLHEDFAAWPIYVNHVASGLAAEIFAWVPWSLRAYNAEQLKVLFDGTRVFTRAATWSDATFKDGRVVYPSYITPTNATFTLEFLKDLDLIRPTRLETISRTIDWAANLSHKTGTGTVDHWQYEGRAPLARVLDGTVRISDDRFGHYTGGCTSTSWILSWTLRPINIPVVNVQDPSGTCGHSVTGFISEAMYLDHGDVPYNRVVDQAAIPGSWLLINQQTFKEWFPTPADTDISCASQDRRPYQLAPFYPGNGLMQDYCEDVKAGASHADGKVFKTLSREWSLQQLEGLKLWDTLQSKVPTTDAWACKSLQVP